MPHVPEHYLQKVAALAMALPTINVGDAAIGVVTLGILILWPRLGIRLPGHLPALLGGCAVMLVVNLLGGERPRRRHIAGCRRDPRPAGDPGAADPRPTALLAAAVGDGRLAADGGMEYERGA